MPDLQSLVSVAPWVVAVGAVLKIILDYIWKRRKQADDSDARVAEVLMRRLDGAERHGVVCDASLAYTRHRMNNLAGTFDAMLMMFEMTPEKATEIVARIKEKRAVDTAAEAIERAEILAAAVAALGDGHDIGDIGEKVQ